jgi:hypothetical protein
MPRENFKALYSNFILNLILKHSSSLDRFTDTMKVKFEGVIHTNPGKFIKGMECANSAVTSIVREVPLVIHRAGSSKIATSLCIPTFEGDITVSTISNDDIGYEFVENKEPLSPTINTDEENFSNINKANLNIILKSNERLDKELTQNMYRYSGESSNESFMRIRKEDLSNVEYQELQEHIAAVSGVNFSILPAYLCNPKFKTLVDASEHIKNIV